MRFIIVVVAASFIVTGAIGQNLSDDQKRAVNELSGEMLDCAVYFLISAQCLEGHPDPRIPTAKGPSVPGRSFSGACRYLGVLAWC
jgi:hypothetical protein